MMRLVGKKIKSIKIRVDKFYKGNMVFEESIFYKTRFPIVEKALTPKKAKIFKKMSFEDKKLFVNVLIEEGKLSW